MDLVFSSLPHTYTEHCSACAPLLEVHKAAVVVAQLVLGTLLQLHVLAVIACTAKHMQCLHSLSQHEMSLDWFVWLMLCSACTQLYVHRYTAIACVLTLQKVMVPQVLVTSC